MVQYIYDAIHVSNGGNNFVALSLTDDEGNVVATGDLTMEICYGVRPLGRLPLNIHLTLGSLRYLTIQILLAEVSIG